MKLEHDKNDKTAAIVFAVLAVLIILLLLVFGGSFIANSQLKRVDAPLRVPAPLPVPDEKFDMQKIDSAIDPLDQTSGSVK